MCVFCEIAAHKVAAQIVFEDEVCMAFLDADPISEGHVLLIPKKHYLDADEIPEEAFMHLMHASQRIIRAVKRAYLPEGYSVMQNGGAFNDVGHYHLHIFPRRDGDGFGWTSTDAEYEASGAVAEKIKAYIK